MSQKIDIRERRYNGADYDTLHPETNINMVLDSSNNSVGSIKGVLECDGAGNVKAGTVSNRNLLDNPWFTVNQRGQSSYTNTSGFSESVDRWKIANRTTLAVVSGGVTLTTTSEISFQQNTEHDLRGETVTASVKVGGVVYSGTTTVPSSGYNLVTLSINGLSVDVRVGYSSGLYFRINVDSSTASLTFRAVKLELGSVSTLANDVTPNYDIELLKCQSSFYMIKAKEAYARIGLGYVSAAIVLIVINLPVPLKSDTPIPTLSGTVTLIGGGVTTTATSVDCLYRTANQLTLAFTTATTIPVGSCCDVYLNAANDYISVSAE